MGADSWLAGLAGGLQGYDQAKTHDEQLDLEKQRLQSQNELRLMLEQLRQSGQTGRTTATNETRRDIAGQTSDDRRYGVDTRAATSAEAEAGRGDRASARNQTIQRGQDLTDDHFWNANALNWDKLYTNDATTRRGQDMRDATQRRGQDSTASTMERGQDLSHGDRQDAIGATGDARAMSYAMRAYGQELQRRKQGNSLFGDQTDQTPTFEDWLQSSDDPEIFPSVKRMFTRGAAPAAAPGPDATAPPAAAAPAIAPRRPAPTRSAIPGARPTAPPAAAAPPKGFDVGATVTLKNGQRVVVTKVNPDGTFEYK